MTSGKANKNREKQELNRIHQILAYADDVNTLVEICLKEKHRNSVRDQ
jgi:hypothetical protein